MSDHRRLAEVAKIIGAAVSGVAGSPYAQEAAEYTAHVNRLAMKYALTVNEADRRFRSYVARVPLSWREVDDPGPDIMLGRAEP